jgi:hypothetical protein
VPDTSPSPHRFRKKLDEKIEKISSRLLPTNTYAADTDIEEDIQHVKPKITQPSTTINTLPDSTKLLTKTAMVKGAALGQIITILNRHCSASAQLPRFFQLWTSMVDFKKSDLTNRENDFNVSSKNEATITLYYTITRVYYLNMKSCLCSLARFADYQRTQKIIARIAKHENNGDLFNPSFFIICS